MAVSDSVTNDGDSGLRHPAMGVEYGLDGVDQLIEPERFVQHGLGVEARLPCLHNRMPRIVTETGHEDQGHWIHEIFQFDHQVVAVHIWQANIDDDDVVLGVRTGISHHEDGLAPGVGRFHITAIPFQQGVSVVAHTLVGIDGQDPAVRGLRCGPVLLGAVPFELVLDHASP